ncbi:unnamed protein product [Caenorhabditis sp. 36 PRJEB53466]|nr:unnamed protein product [Caenorhabditis sp. 36 PRJEB53466]
MENAYDVEDQTSNCYNSNHTFLAKLFCGIFLLAVCLVVAFSIIFAFRQQPVDISFKDIDEMPKQEPGEPLPVPMSSRSNNNYRKFTSDDLWSGKEYVKDSYNYMWLKDGTFLYNKDFFLSATNITKVAKSSFEPEHFLENYELLRTASSDRKYAYIATLVRMVFRYSSERIFNIVRIDNSSIPKDNWHVGPEDGAVIQAFYWNPKVDSHDFAYVHNYNLYYQKDPEKPESAVQLTTNGTFFERFGVANWLYEEEILARSNAVWWSPSGRYLSYLKFDDSKVNRIFLTRYTKEDNYVEYNEIAYPKAGVPHNTLVTQYIWDSESHKIVETEPPNELREANGNYYILQNKWIQMPEKFRDLGKERLITIWSNRDQTVVHFSLCNESDCIMTFSFPFTIDGKNLWVEPTEVGSIFTTTTGFVTILPRKRHDGNIYNQIAHIELESTGLGKITKWLGDNFDVAYILDYSLETDILIFGGYGTGIGEENIYKISNALRSSEKNELVNLNSLLEDCGYVYKSSMDPTGEKLMFQCQTPFQNARLYMMDIVNTSKQVLLEGKEQNYLPFDSPEMQFGQIKLSSGIEGHYMIMTPPSNPVGKKIPVLVDLYGGPNSKRVNNKTPSAQLIQICSEYEVAIVQVDVCGTAGRGWNVKEPIYRNLGECEINDTLAMIKELLLRHIFLDEDRIAVMGWSYGGYLATKLVAQDQGELVKCAIAIAPVTDFKYYDSAYTERYMGQPEENASGYNKTNLIPHAGNLTNVKYFLAHGERDDNVHYQNSARWSEALQINGIHFTQLVYANEAHGLSGKIKHLYSEVNQFLVNNCFKVTTDFY